MTSSISGSDVAIVSRLLWVDIRVEERVDATSKAQRIAPPYGLDPTWIEILEACDDRAD